MSLLKKIQKKGKDVLFWHILVPFYKVYLNQCRITPNKIVFENFLGKGFADNPRYIAEELATYNTDLDLVWLVDDLQRYMLPNYMREVEYNSLRGMYERATAKVWVSNCRGYHPVRKKRKQIYLQTWHAPFSPKCLEGDAEEKLSAGYCSEAKYDGLITDGIIVNSDLLEEQYRRSFWLNESTEYLRFGLPRYDYLIKHKDETDYIDRIKTKYGFPSDSYIVLYAPTFRDDNSIDGYGIDFHRVAEAFSDKLGKDVRIIVRFHPNITEYSNSISYSEKIINGTYISDIQELSLISNCIITDYSTTVFDFVVLDRPALLFTLDIKHFEDIRGLLPEFYNFPFPRSNSNDELIEHIKNFDRKKYDDAIKTYFEQHPIYDIGDASKKTALWILDKMGINKCQSEENDCR